MPHDSTVLNYRESEFHIDYVTELHEMSDATMNCR